MIKILNKAKVIFRIEGPLVLFKKSLRFLIEEITGLFYQYSLISYTKSDELPAVIEVSAEDINWKSTFSKQQFPTTDGNIKKYDVPYDQPIVGILGGPWDLFKTKWESSQHHQSLKKHFEKDVPWEETKLYRQNIAKIDAGMTGQSGVETANELKQRCLKIDELYFSMSKRGYVPQSKLTTNKSPIDSSNTKRICGISVPDECRIGIGRTGELIRFSAGRHRLSIAKLLDLDAIPVVVIVRHSRWQTIREAFQDAESVEELPETYQKYSDHPDIQEFV